MIIDSISAGVAFTTRLESAAGLKGFKWNQKELRPVAIKCPHALVQRSEPNFPSLGKLRIRPAPSKNPHIPPTPLLDESKCMLQWSRLEVPLNAPGDYTALVAFIRSRPREFDLYSVVVRDEKVWQTVIADGLVDIISLPVYEGRLPFPVKRAQLLRVTAQKICLDVSLAPALHSPGVCTHLFRNVAYILRYLKPQSFLLGSGAAHPFDLRAVDDLVALLRLCGITAPETARKCFLETPFDLVRNAFLKRFHNLPIAPQPTTKDSTREGETGEGRGLGLGLREQPRSG